MKSNIRTKNVFALALAAAMLMMPVAQAEQSTSTQASTQTTENAQGMPSMQDCTCETCTTEEPHICTCSSKMSDSSQAGNTDGQTPHDKPDGESSDGQTPPSKPDGESSDGQTPPSKPDGESSGGQTPPSKPDGESSDGQTPPSKPDGESSGGSQPEMLTCSCDDAQPLSMSGMGGGMPGGFGGSGTVTNGTSATTISEDSEISGTTYTSDGDDENALRIDGATVTLDGVTVDKSGGESSNSEDGDFYGQNAAILALNGANVTITDANITTNAKNGNAVFSYGDGTVVNISDSMITTTQNNSGGIQTTGGGTTNASNLTVETSGNSAAAIRSDRGGGTVNVDGGTYTTNGTGSPAVYSTADITVSNAVLTANDSEVVVIEGKSSAILNNCESTGSMSVTKQGDSSDNIHNVMIYQSMSGDAEEGTAVFSAIGGSLTALKGDMIYVTNTDCTITLSEVDLTLANGKLLTIEGNSSSRGWGTAGANGADVVFTADAQVLTGDITVDTISTLDMTLSNNSAFTGTINIVENAAGGQAVDNNAVVTIEEGSTWSLTGDSVITSLNNQGTIEYNGYTITLADGTVLSE